MSNIISISLNNKEIINFDDFNLTNDFFNPVTGFSFKLAGKDVEQVKNIPTFADVVIKIDNITILIGNLDEKSYSSSRSGGTVCELSGRNVLGYVADSTIFPDVQNNFKTGITYKDVFKGIFEQFPHLQTFLVGLDRTDKALQKKLTAQLKAKQVLNRCEGCLELAIRFAKRSGWFINAQYDLFDGVDPALTTTILLTSPRYDTTPLNVKKYTSLSYKVDTSKQPTILIANGKPLDGYAFKPVSTTSAFVNEIIGFNFINDGESGQITSQPLPSVLKYIQDNKLQKAVGKEENPLNNDGVPADSEFIKVIYNIDPAERKDLVRPYYWYDDNSITAAEIKKSGEMKLHDFQRGYFQCSVSLNGFFDNSNLLLTPNRMINISFELDNIKTLWISKVTYNYSRSGGATINLTLNLPFIYSDIE